MNTETVDNIELSYEPAIIVLSTPKELKAWIQTDTYKFILLAPLFPIYRRMDNKMWSAHGDIDVKRKETSRS